ncbi:SsrA-binding protein SmpB [Candidatus Magnetomonas plexicatena]|uniref:SsrA-binding protein SmpB n=1 Tax=Candidatus Magnetomonas plexicatena TaxID=2552947 RepID=UPI004033082E
MCYNKDMRLAAQNKKAYHDYTIEETLEAGVSLKGTEVKAIREGRINLRDSYVIIKDKEAFMLNCHISPYSHGNIMNHEPLRTRKLLFHIKEILKLVGKTAQRGYSLIPLKVYFKGPYVKVEVGLAKGKREYEKREKIKERDIKREMDREFS